MTTSLDRLKRIINPKKAALLLGAGSSIPSGAPSAAELAAYLWKKVDSSPAKSSDLQETTEILSLKYGRASVVGTIKEALLKLRPSSGLRALIQFDWSAIFTTNFDRLLEQACLTEGRPAIVIRSNFDFAKLENDTGLPIYKIHGCVTQDEVTGHKSRMLLTQQDYDDLAKYRESLFARLGDYLLSRDVVVLGQSLADKHLRDAIFKASALKGEKGAPGEIYVIVYEKDEDRAALLEIRGVKVVFAGLDEFVHAIADTENSPTSSGSAVASADSELSLPTRLLPTVSEVGYAADLMPDVSRMFNGAAATYPDIRAGVTFKRTAHDRAIKSLIDDGKQSLVVLGAAGAGKTTFARQILTDLASRDFVAWEHKSDFPLRAHEWLKIEETLHAEGKRGALLLDECTHFLGQSSELIDGLSEVEEPALSVVLTANAALWAPRNKSPVFFSRGTTVELSSLDQYEIARLISLVETNPQIAALVDHYFRGLTRFQKEEHLKQRCSAEMYVCLKNIFANESLDNIILREYADLELSSQEHYRYIAALEAVGTRVHRQLIIRMLGIKADAVTAVLTGLSGIIEEYDVNAKEGIYGWSTRHSVIARKLTEYKYSAYPELVKLFNRIIDNINPSVPIELRTVRDICDSEFGIGRLAEIDDRVRLFRRLIEMAPSERIPWHRLISLTLKSGQYETADHIIRDAERAVGEDAPLSRYKVRALIVRAERTPGIGADDRLAILRKGYETAMINTRRHSRDKYAYFALCDVAVLLARGGESPYMLDEAISRLREAENKLLDPDITKSITRYERERARLN